MEESYCSRPYCCSTKRNLVWVTYVEPQAHYYENYFKNIVGVTHPNNAEVVNVHVRAHNHYMFMLTETINTS